MQEVAGFQAGEGFGVRMVRSRRYRTSLALTGCGLTQDLVVCIGATQAFGAVNEAFRNTLFAVKDMLKPGGKLLLGDLYWRKHPSKDYLAMLEYVEGCCRQMIHCECACLTEPPCASAAKHLRMGCGKKTY